MINHYLSASYRKTEESEITFYACRVDPGASDGNGAEPPGVYAPKTVGVNEKPSKAKAFEGEMGED